MLDVIETAARVAATEAGIALTVLVHAQVSAACRRTRLVLSLRDGQGYAITQLTLDGPALSVGAQVITVTVELPPCTIAAVDGELHALEGQWIPGPTGIGRFQAPQSTPPAASAVPAAPVRPPPPWERFAVDRSAPVEPRPAPSGSPWGLLDAGKIEEAMAAFDRHQLSERGRRRMEALLTSDDAAEVAHGCRISRLVRWVSTRQLLPLLTHPAAAVRREAVDSLGRVAGASQLPAIHALLDDPSPDVQRAAQHASERAQGQRPRW